MAQMGALSKQNRNECICRSFASTSRLGRGEERLLWFARLPTEGIGALLYDRGCSPLFLTDVIMRASKACATWLHWTVPGLSGLGTFIHHHFVFLLVFSHTCKCLIAVLALYTNRQTS